MSSQSHKISQVLRRPAVFAFIADRLRSALLGLEQSPSKVPSLVGALLEAASRAPNDRQAEASLKELLDGLGVKEALNNQLGRRAKLIYDQVQPYVDGNTVLDLGCGDGLVAARLAEGGRDVRMVDIMDYRSEASRLPFLLWKDERLPFESGSQDTVLLLTVLHHAHDPIALLRECVRVCRGRIILIESVVGVSASDAEGLGPEASAFASLGAWQRDYATFIDWFYNRVLHDDVPVPYNFRSPADWQAIFDAAGLEEVALRFLGIDQPLVPEFHTLHVQRKA